MTLAKQILSIDNWKCVMCGKCVQVCPKNAIGKIQNQNCSKCIKYCISYEVPCNPYKYVICQEKCDLCLKCISVCNEKAINWVMIPKKNENII
ncbi:MAG: 4Fe-4S binding protein [Bacteroidales bacterium]|nr:4Fe-4S binding protein [Bacteroidales bacterium]